MNIEFIALKLKEVGAENFGADLKKGRIFWTSDEGNEVCSGSCQAILTYAGTNHSLLWCAANQYMKDFPHVEMPENQVGYIEKTTEEEARKIAFDYADQIGAEFFYAAPVAAGGYVYLAVFNLIFESKTLNINSDEVNQNIIEYIRAKSTRMANIQNIDEQMILLKAFTEDLENQINNAPKNIKNLQECLEILESLKAMQSSKLDKKTIDQQLLQMGDFLK